MVTHKFSKLLLIVLMAATVAGAAAAQDGAGGRGNGGHGPGGRGGMGGRGAGNLVAIVQQVTEATDLTAREVTQALLSGQTVLEILTANGADPEAFVQDSLTQARERLSEQVTAGKLTQAQADERLIQVEASLRAFVFEGTLPEGGPGEQTGRPLVQLGQIIIEQAGLDAQTVIQSLREGKTLTNLIEEAGQDVAVVRQASIDAATVAINDAVTAGTLTQERADQMITNLGALIDRLLTGGVKSGMEDGKGPRGGRLMAAIVAEATGLTVEEVRAEVASGKTLADVLTSHNVIVDAFVETHLQTMTERLAERVTNGTITQAIADARLDLARIELTERLNNNLNLDDAGPMDMVPMTTPEATAES